jgi:hypothetical protein
VTIGLGGILSAGNSIGEFTIERPLIFKPGSYFDVEIDPGHPWGTGNDGQGVSDQVFVTGPATLSEGTTVRHYAVEGLTGNYFASNPEAITSENPPDRRWFILGADEFEGKFNPVVESDIPYLLPQLYYADEEGDDGIDDTLYLWFNMNDGVAEAVTEGGSTGSVLLNQGADFLVGRGFDAALHENARTGFNLFAIVGGGSLRYKTGGSSRIDANGTTAVVGFSGTRDTAVGELTLGAFFEHGAGGYDTVNSLADSAHKGEADYTGGGVLAHLKLDETELGHFYAEATARWGKLDLDFRTRDRAVTYESRSDYGSAHMGLGYALKITEYSALKLYGQYLWGRQGSDTVKLCPGDVPVEFKAIDSQRTRLGARWEHAVGQTGRFRFGAAWEREYDGKSEARFPGGSSSVASKLKGDTGIAEFGFTLNPVKSLRVDVDVQSYIGRREGVTGSVKVEYRF